MADEIRTTPEEVIRRIDDMIFEPDWWFDGACAFRNGFDRSVPDRVPSGEPTVQWLAGWDEEWEIANG